MAAIPITKISAKRYYDYGNATGVTDVDMRANSEECTVHYYPGQIVLTGNPPQIQQEAHVILRRFACSAIPYRVIEDRGTRMVLAPMS